MCRRVHCHTCRTQKKTLTDSSPALAHHDCAAALAGKEEQHHSNGKGVPAEWAAQLQALEMERQAVREQHRSLLAQHHKRFHSTWGQLLKTGYQNSRFAHQVRHGLLRLHGVGAFCAPVHAWVPSVHQCMAYDVLLSRGDWVVGHWGWVG